MTAGAEADTGELPKVARLPWARVVGIKLAAGPRFCLPRISEPSRKM